MSDSLQNVDIGGLDLTTLFTFEGNNIQEKTEIKFRWVGQAASHITRYKFNKITAVSYNVSHRVLARTVFGFDGIGLLTIAYGAIIANFDIARNSNQELYV